MATNDEDRRNTSRTKPSGDDERRGGYTSGQTPATKLKPPETGVKKSSADKDK